MGTQEAEKLARASISSTGSEMTNVDCFKMILLCEMHHDLSSIK